MWEVGVTYAPHFFQSSCTESTCRFKLSSQLRYLPRVCKVIQQSLGMLSNFSVIGTWWIFKINLGGGCILNFTVSERGLHYENMSFPYVIFKIQGGRRPPLLGLMVCGQPSIPHYFLLCSATCNHIHPHLSSSHLLFLSGVFGSARTMNLKSSSNNL